MEMSFDAGVPLGVGDYVGQVTDGVPDGQVRRHCTVLFGFVFCFKR